MRALRARPRLGWLLVVLPTTGCSFIFAHGPPEGHEAMPAFDCTVSTAAPVLDIVWGSLALLSTIVIATDPDSYEATYGGSAGVGIAVNMGWVALSSFAAATGFKKSKHCRAAKADLARRQPPPVPPDTSADAIRAVTIAPALDTLPVGQTIQLVATARTSSGSVAPGRTYAWSPSNDATASVSDAGLVTAHAPGTVVVAARTGSIVGTARIVVRPEQ